MLGWPASLAQTTVAAGLVGVVVYFVRCHQKSTTVELGGLISSLLAGSAVPTGFFLLACGFKPAMITDIGDLGLYLAAAGLALLFVSAKELFT